LSAEIIFAFEDSQILYYRYFPSILLFIHLLLSNLFASSSHPQKIAIAYCFMMIQRIILFLGVLAITTYAIMLDMIFNIRRTTVAKFVFPLLTELLFLRFLDQFSFVAKFIKPLFFS